MIKISIQDLRIALSARPPGYYEEVISAGKSDGHTLYLEERVYQSLREKFNPKTPSVKAMAKSAVKSIFGAIKNPTKVSDEERDRRLAICRSCEFLIKTEKSERCAKCGCFVTWKTKLEAWHCPVGKW